MKPLAFNIKVMKALTLWPEKETSIIYAIRQFILFFMLCPSACAGFLGMIHQINKLEDINILLDHIIGMGTLVAMVYMCQCFINNVQNICDLVEKISSFEVFGAQETILETENTVKKYTKGILLYGVIGNLCYAVFPLSHIDECMETRTDELVRQRDPCGLIVHVWYPFDISWFPRFQIAYLLQMYTCTFISVVVLALTMILVGLLMYAVSFIKHCRQRIRECCEEGTTDAEKRQNVTYCIRYHIAIILYASNVTKAFSSMMLMHITLTSFVISVLGFEVLMVTSRTDSLRFGMHLLGWLVLLFLICSYGQKLIDESSSIGWDAYSTCWYCCPVEVQKDLQLMILRTQRPLTLSAASLGVMSLETYLGVMSTAYSYFTLLLNIKSK